MWDRLDWLIKFAAIWFVVRLLLHAGEVLTGEGLGPVASVTLDWIDALAIASIGIKFAYEVWQDQ